MKFLSRFIKRKESNQGEVVEAFQNSFASNNAFLNDVDRYVDCSDFKLISRKRFAELFGQEKAKGAIDATDLASIKKMTAEYEDASPKILKRFGLI